MQSYAEASSASPKRAASPPIDFNITIDPVFDPA